MQQIMFIEGMKPLEEVPFTNREGKADQLKLREGGWVQVSLEFSVQDRQTKEGKTFKSQTVRISNIAPLWGHVDSKP